jgi:hypothetical protein
MYEGAQEIKNEDSDRRKAEGRNKKVRRNTCKILTGKPEGKRLHGTTINMGNTYYSVVIIYNITLHVSAPFSHLQVVHVSFRLNLAYVC